MSYSSRSKHSTSSAWLATMTAVAAALVVLMLAGCNPFAGSSGTTTGPAVPTSTTSAATSSVTTIPLVTVPDVTTLDVEDAQSGLLDKGLLFTVKWHRSSTVPALEVYKQRPEPGDEVSPGTYVTLYTSIGTQANNRGMKTDAPPKPRKPRWVKLPDVCNAWLLTGVGEGTSSSKYFNEGWLGVSGLVAIPIRVRLNHPDGTQDNVVDTQHPVNSHDIRIDQPLGHPGSTVRKGDARTVVREDQVRILRVVPAEEGGYKVVVHAGWNQPWVVLVRWASRNKRGTYIYPPVWP